jgi:regulator of sigma E protease
MSTVIIFILVLGLLVFVHELGHFVAARKSGIKVYEFGFGMPPRILGVYRDPKTKKLVWKWGTSKKSGLKETIVGEQVDEEYPDVLYTINLLPIGGFVRMKGENGEDKNESDSFGYQKAWKKIIVLSAGVTMNVLLAAVLFGAGFMIGLPADISGGVDDNAIIIEQPQVLVQMVEKGSPADEAGVEFGDIISSVNNTHIETGDQMVSLIAKNGEKEVDLLVKRGEEEIPLVLTPAILNGEDNARLGFALVDAAIVKYPWYIAIYKGFVAAILTLASIFVAFYLLIKNLIIGQGLAMDVSGPVGIAVMIGQSARLGINYLLNITAMISLSLAAINILPIPALDGGRILFILIEKITRKPVPMKYEQIAHTIGFIFLMTLIIIITGRDVIGLF